MSRKSYEKLVSDEDGHDDDEKKNCHPATTANFLSILTFWWMNGLFKTGSERPLEQSDFLPLHHKDKTRDLTERLWKTWNNHVQECNKTEGRQPKLWKCVLKNIYWQEHIVNWCGFLVESTCRVIQPLLLGIIIDLLTSGELNRKLAYTYATLLVLSFLPGICTHTVSYKCELLGMRLISALRGIIYLKIPLLSQLNLRQITTGRIIDLISNDVQRLEEVPNWLLASTLSIIEVPAVICLLIYLIGWQALLGVLFQLLTVPYIVLVSSLSAGLRQRTADVTDMRMSLLDELVHGIRVLKTHALELYYGDKIKDVRRKEVRIILQKSAFLSTIESLQFSVTPIATFLSVLCLVLTGQQLTPASAFMLLSFLHVLQIGLHVYITNAMLSVYESFVSLERIENFLLTENLCCNDKLQGCFNGNFLTDKSIISYSTVSTNTSLPAIPPKDQRTELRIKQSDGHFDVPAKESSEELTGMLSVSDLACKAGNSYEKYLLEKVSLQVKENTLTVITGHVGSGKSTLLASIAGEVALTTGAIICPENIAYFPQTAWIFSATLRDNILFGKSYDKGKYLNVIQTCALKEDMERFSNGDLTFVGERGAVLSGGQRARVSLARAVYADADVYLLDDPLSAVDLKIAEHIFNHCIRRLLQNKIRVMVTYTESHMKAADQVVVLYKGSVLGKGSFYELREGNVLSTVLDAADTDIEDRTRYRKQDQQESVQLCLETGDDNLGECLDLSEEDRGIGTISSKLYWDYFRAGIHAVAIVAMIVFFLGTQVFMVSSDFWLTHLTTMPWEYQYDVTPLSVYGGLVFAAVVVVAVRAYLFFHSSLRSSERLHDKMVNCLLKAPVLFFDTNPAGRILNRFSKDIGCIDEILPKTFLSAIQYLLFVGAAALVPSITNFWLSIISLPVFLAFVFLTRYYLKTSRELKRLESICRTPVFSHFSETMDGLDTIRTRKAEEQFIDQFYRHQDLHNRVFSLVAANGRWFGVRIDFLSLLFIAVVAFASIFLSQSAALAGLALVYVMKTTNLSQLAVRAFTKVESLMTSVERVVTYTSLDTEPGYTITAPQMKNWPRDGHIRFKNVVLRYYSGGPQVLKNLSFEIQGKERIGIVGRTGDGKSSIVAALLRMPEAEGEILIDDVSTKSVQLQEARRCISVLNQTPVLFRGSIRKNLDPFKNFTDSELWSAVEDVQLKSLVESVEGKLDYEMSERGGNLSVGERQLLCLARTLLQQNTIVVLDEPTAHVDPNTERIIWNIVNEKLKQSTVITIAHRLNTVRHCDLILVLKEGQVAELGTYDELLGREGGVFHNMVTSQTQV
ncbi:ATP-binding cassette sub-family C member 4-like [Oculina patagonica]